MAKRSAFRSKGRAGEVSFNMTPMIDCVFQLILFFLLASHFASETLARVDLSHPVRSQARDPEKFKMPDRIVVNVVSLELEQLESQGSDAVYSDDPMIAGAAKAYKIGGEHVEIGDVARLIEVFEQAAGPDKEDFYVEIRADRRVDFAAVAPVMSAATRAGIGHISISAIRDSSKGGE